MSERTNTAGVSCRSSAKSPTRGLPEYTLTRGEMEQREKRTKKERNTDGWMEAYGSGASGREAKDGEWKEPPAAQECIC